MYWFELIRILIPLTLCWPLVKYSASSLLKPNMLQHFISRRSLRAFTPQVLNTHSLEFKNCASTFAFWRRYTTLQRNEIITKAFNPANSNKFMVLNGGLPHVTVAGGLPNRKFPKRATKGLQNGYKRVTKRWQKGDKRVNNMRVTKRWQKGENELVYFDWISEKRHKTGHKNKN